MIPKAKGCGTEMGSLIVNARMYAVTPAVEEAWKELLARIFEAAEVHFDYVSYPAPQPMEGLWERPDLGCVFMCGFPIALEMADVRPIAAPIPSLSWAGGRAVYRSDLIVPTDAPWRRLEDTFGRRTGWTVEHSHSGFNAWRHHLLAYRSEERPKLYATSIGHLVTARRILDSVSDGAIDIGPLDAYWHALIAKHAPDLVEGVRAIDHTMFAPMPAFVAGPLVEATALSRLKESFVAASRQPWFPAFAEALLLQGFAAVEQADFAVMLERDAAAAAAGYGAPG
jgi:ABC-type phosphate/phosphonate transport system substrate-binding protein